VFRNVGQGLFYTGKIGEFTFVYDCGSNSGMNYVEKAVDDFHNEVQSTKLGMLVISHFDSDYINGIQKLS
jgi:beta-lactamase superfamily II metal-dependent hydrolase